MAESTVALYKQGKKKFREGLFKQALSCFMAANRNNQDPERKNKYASAIGMTQVFMGDRSGLNLCRRLAEIEPFDGDVALHLAQAELHIKHRKQAIAAIEHGLRISPRHKGLNHLQRMIGRRRTPPFNFLERDHFLNKVVGKMTYKSYLKKQAKHPILSKVA